MEKVFERRYRISTGIVWVYRTSNRNQGSLRNFGSNTDSMPNTKLVGDVGATGSAWGLITASDIRKYQSSGYNPVSQGEDQLHRMVEDVVGGLSIVEPVELVYYGAGAGSQHFVEQIGQGFRRQLNVVRMQMGSDLLAAAHALCGDAPGVVAILGTGSNSGTYNGKEIVLQTATLGYPLGDEGSGMDLGKRLVKSFYYDLMPAHLRDLSRSLLPDDRYEFLQTFRAASAPNRFLADYTRFIHAHRQDAWMNALISAAFNDFIEIHLRHHEKQQKINFVGSIAFYFCDELKSTLLAHELQMGRVLRKPIDALLEFHNQ